MFSILRIIFSSITHFLSFFTGLVQKHFAFSLNVDNLFSYCIIRHKHMMPIIRTTSLPSLHDVVTAKRKAHCMQETLRQKESRFTPEEIRERLIGAHYFFLGLEESLKQFNLTVHTTWQGARETVSKIINSSLSRDKGLKIHSREIENKICDFLQSELSEYARNVITRTELARRFFDKLQALYGTSSISIKFSDLILTAFHEVEPYEYKDLGESDYRRLLELAEMVVGL